MKKLITLASLMFMSSLANATEHYLVKAKIFDKQSLMASPSVIVDVNKQALVEVTNLFSLQLVIEPLSDSIVRLNTEVTLKEKLMSPTIDVELGKQATITLGDTTLVLLVEKNNS